MEEFIKGTFNEAELEAAIIEMFENQNYEYVNGYSLHRRPDNILLKNDLRSYLANRYQDLTPSEITKVISKLKNVPYSSLYQEIERLSGCLMKALIFRVRIVLNLRFILIILILNTLKIMFSRWLINTP